MSSTEQQAETTTQTTQPRKVGRPRKYATDKERSAASHKKRSERDRAFTALKKELKKQNLTAQQELIEKVMTEILDDKVAKSMLELCSTPINTEHNES